MHAPARKRESKSQASSLALDSRFRGNDGKKDRSFAAEFLALQPMAESLAPKGARDLATPQMQTLASGGKPLKATAE